MLIKNGIISSSSCFAKRGAGCGGLKHRESLLFIHFFLSLFWKNSP